MRRHIPILFSPLMLLFVVSCGNSQMTVLEGAGLVNSAVEAAANSTTRLLNDDRISIKEACVVDQYGRLARVSSDEAVAAWATGDIEGAEGHIQAARSVLAGTAAGAAALVDDHCAGE